jgi:hypothetical protein
VLLHGLCMNDLQWRRAGHDHGRALARDLDYTPVYLRYNSGLHISTNGRRFSAARRPRGVRTGSSRTGHHRSQHGRAGHA